MLLHRPPQAGTTRDLTSAFGLLPHYNTSCGRLHKELGRPKAGQKPVARETARELQARSADLGAHWKGVARM